MQWSRAGLPCAIVILALLPVLASPENLPLVLMVTLLPVYMIHQFGEHAHGRFSAFFNRELGRGHEVLSPLAIFWVNIGLVWIVFLVAFYLARFVAIAFALVPVYLTLVNAVTHVLASVKLRVYNPGLWTSLALFLPWCGYLLVTFNRLSGARPASNALALLFALGVHAGIFAWAMWRRSQLRSDGDRLRSGPMLTG